MPESGISLRSFRKILSSLTPASADVTRSVKVGGFFMALRREPSLQTNAAVYDIYRQDAKSAKDVKKEVQAFPS
jgi:hypothetical protein